MTIFWMISALLLGIALVFVVWPLWFAKTRDNTVVRDAANLEIFRDQMAEMEADLANGLLTPELFEQGKKELQARLLEEVKDPAATSAAARKPLKVLALAVSLLIPLLSVAVYMKVGNTHALLPQMGLDSAAGFGMARTDAALRDLEEKAAQSQEPEILLMLARSYTEMERYADAAKTYEQLTQLIPNEPGLWADYADVLAMAHGQNLSGAPTRLLEKALLLDPNHAKSLALAGSAAMERGDYASAVRYWENLIKQLPANSEDAKMIGEGIEQARQFLSMQKGKGSSPSAKPGVAKESITGTVSLAPELKNAVSPDDTVFVLARAAQGPKMPLAILRKQVRDLPLNFSLDDSMAMAPQMKLSGFAKVVVIARVSKSGNAMPEAGDLQGSSAEISPGSQNIVIRINQRL